MRGQAALIFIAIFPWHRFSTCIPFPTPSLSRPLPPALFSLSFSLYILENNSTTRPTLL